MLESLLLGRRERRAPFTTPHAGGSDNSGAPGNARFFSTYQRLSLPLSGPRKRPRLGNLKHPILLCKEIGRLSSEAVWKKQVVMQLSGKATRGGSTTEGLSSCIASALGRER